MAVDSVRRLAEATQPERLPLPSTAKFDFTDREELEAVDLLNDENDYFPTYDFEGQSRIYHEFKFTTEPIFGSPKTATGVLEIRESSDLVFLILDQDTPKPSTIFEELSNSSQYELPLKSDFSPTYENICEFIRAATSISKVESPSVNDPAGAIRDGDNIPVEMARLRFEWGNCNKKVVYSDAQLQIAVSNTPDTLLEEVSQERSLREYVIQVFEMAFR